MMDALVADVQTYKGYEEREIERENGLVFNMFLWIKKIGYLGFLVAQFFIPCRMRVSFAWII